MVNVVVGRDDDGVVFAIVGPITLNARTHSHLLLQARAQQASEEYDPEKNEVGSHFRRFRVA